MYRKIEDFVNDWQDEAKYTLNLFSKISDDKISVRVAENIRNLGRLAWHITQTLTEMPHKAGIIEKDHLEDKDMPATFAEIIATYQDHNDALIELLRKKWRDSELTDKIEMYGQQWEKRKILSALVHHQIHHRAQMTIIMRLQDIEVPGIYGPSKEEWTKFGMKPQE